EGAEVFGMATIAEEAEPVSGTRFRVDWKKRWPPRSEHCCPMCDDEDVVAGRYSETIPSFGGAPGFRVHGLEGDYCCACGETFIRGHAVRRNELKFEAARDAAATTLREAAAAGIEGERE